MRGKSRWLPIAGLLACVLAFAPTAAADKPGPKVVCLTDFDGESALGVYAYKPQKCIVHERGEPFASYALVLLKKLRWKSWSPGQARGEAIVRGNMGYKAKTDVRLLKPRKSCGGPKVFSLMKIKTRDVNTGATYSGKVHLDTCLR